VARSLDRATDESSSARRVSSNGSEAACLTTHPTDDPLLVARLTSARLIRRPSSSPRSLSPASLHGPCKRLHSIGRPADSPVMSRRPVFAPDTLTRPFKSWRTFNALNRSCVRVLVADGPLSATSAAPQHHKPHDQVDRYLFVAQCVVAKPSQQNTVFTSCSHSSTPIPTQTRTNRRWSSDSSAIRLHDIVRALRTPGDSAAHLVRHRSTPYLRQQRPTHVTTNLRRPISGPTDLHI
jgi:hypothetical protein